MKNNKLVLSYCKNFEKINNTDFLEGDNLSLQLVKIYKDYIFSIDVSNEQELQNAIEVDNVKNVILFNKEDYKKYIEDKTAFSKIENLWVNQNIIFDAKEIKKLQKKHFKYIPKEFFGQEMMEAAE